MQEYFWNSLGQLDSATTNGVTVARFWYDGLGRRVRKWSAAGARSYVHDGHALLAELDGNGNRLAEYTYYPGVDHPHSVRRWSGGTSAMYYFATDHPGNVVGLIDAANQLVNRYKYTPFGSSEGSRETVENTLQFGARELDTETGLYYNRARYYDPSLGRFISEDPAGFSSGVNLYVYASNDPMNRRDPFGLSDDCSTIDVKVTEANGDVSKTQITICKGGGSTIGQILDWGQTIGVGNGSAYWGGGVFATSFVGGASGPNVEILKPRQVIFNVTGLRHCPRMTLTTPTRVLGLRNGVVSLWWAAGVRDRDVALARAEYERTGQQYTVRYTAHGQFTEPETGRTRFYTVDGDIACVTGRGTLYGGTTP